MAKRKDLSELIPTLNEEYSPQKKIRELKDTNEALQMKCSTIEEKLAHAPQYIDVSLISEKENIRSAYVDESIKELSSSIAEYGLLQPIGVYEDKGGYTVLFGHRRLRACKLLEMETVPAYVYASEHGDRVKLLRVTENIQREDLSPADLEVLVLDTVKIIGSQIEVANMFHKSKGWISQVLEAGRIRSSLDPSMQEKVKDYSYSTLRKKNKNNEISVIEQSSKPKNQYVLQIKIDAEGKIHTAHSGELSDEYSILLTEKVNDIINVLLNHDNQAEAV